MKPALKETLKSFDASEYGGAPLLGLKGLVVKTHGSSKANEFKNSILQCISFSEEKIPQKVQEHLADYKSSRAELSLSVCFCFFVRKSELSEI